MAALTTNLKLVKYTIDDPVTESAAGYGENFDKIDEALGNIKTDYVTAQGTQGSWTYRRWNSGIQECWGTVKITNANNFAAGGIYDLPVIFSKVNSVMATVGNGQFSNSYKSLDINIKAWCDHNNRVTLWGNSKDAAFGTYTSVPISVEIKGKWK